MFPLVLHPKKLAHIWIWNTKSSGYFLFFSWQTVIKQMDTKSSRKTLFLLLT